MELEVAVDRDRDRSSAARKVQELLGDLVYLKDDGSIGHGFEIVTHPMSYQWAMDEFPWANLPELTAAGCYASDSCGIHVHVSREAFTGPAHEYRFLQFWHRNKAGITRVARRESDQWAAFMTDPENRAAVLKQVVKDKRIDHNRYRAVNTQNDKTLEVRVFASTLQAASIKADLGLVAATVEYSAMLRSPDILKGNGWVWDRFAEWTSKQGRYAPLSEEIVRIGSGAR
jgi:hypothetical protein